MANVLPRPGPGLLAVSVPPCISTSCRARPRPRPRPPRVRSSEASAWVNISNIRGSTSGAMPMPRSATRMTTSLPETTASRSMRPPGGEYLLALLSRLPRLCVRRAASTSMYTGCRGTLISSCCPAMSIAGRQASTASSTTELKLVGARCRLSLSKASRPMSIRSSISRTINPTCRSIVCRSRSMVAASAVPRCSTANDDTSGASGLRSSWASIARKWSLRALASRTASSARFRSVMSRMAAIRPTTVPCASRSGA